MKNIQLKKLELTNYRNIEHSVYEFNGNSKIIGDNRIGKTNTLESIHFLLTGYLLNGSSDIQAIKPLNNSRAIVSVKGTFDVDGKEITLEKKYGEEWVKQRNTGNEVLKGHFCELWYNGIKQSTTKEYNNLFYADFGISQSDTVKISFTQMLCNPTYIGDLCDTDDWKEVRKFIVELVGDVSDEDVFNKEPTTRAITPDLEKANGRIDQVKKAINDDIKSLNESLLTDDAKIEMLSKVDCPTDEEVDMAKTMLTKINDDISALRSNSGNLEAKVNLKNKIADVERKIFEQRQIDSTENKDNELVDLRKSSNDLLTRKSDIQFKIQSIKYNVDSLVSKMSVAEKDKSDLLLEYRTLKGAKVEVETVCPTCKRPLDPSQVEKARNEIIENNKTRMDLIVLDGKKKADEIENFKYQIDKCNKDIDAYEKELDEINTSIISITEQIVEKEHSSLEQVDSEKLVELKKEKANLENELNELELADSNARQQVSQQIYDLENKKAPYQKVLDDYAYAQRQRETKAQVERERKEHSRTLITKEQEKDLVQKFMFTKLLMLDANVSSVFGNIKFQLIKENLNGGFDTVCKPYIYDPIKKESTSVFWRSGSKSEKVATGIAIAECIKAKLNLSNFPFLFDEGGEISDDTMKNRLVTESQVICVKVQDNINSPMVLSI